MFYLTSFLVLQATIRKNGVTMSTVFSKLSVLVPTLISILAFGEQPTVWGVAGFALALAAIVLMNTGAEPGQIASRGLLLLMLLVGGLGDVMSKVYDQIGPAQWSSSFLAFTFAVALVLCGILCVLRKERLTLREWLFGLLLGVPNYFSAYFLLRSLAQVPATAAFPTFAVGVPAVVSLVGILLFRERLTRRQWTAMGIIAVSLVLLNL